MAWKPTGFRRTLKIKITKHEVNNYTSDEITTIDGNKTDFTGSTSYTWTTGGKTMNRSDLSEFNTRTGATKTFIESVFPSNVYNNILWSNVRVGANVYLWFTGLSNDTSFNVALFKNGDGISDLGYKGVSISALEIIRCKVFLQYFTDETQTTTTDVTRYLYIDKNTHKSTIYIINPNTFQNNFVHLPNVGSIITFYVSEFVNVTTTSFSTIKTNTSTDTIINDQYIYDYDVSEFNSGA